MFRKARMMIMPLIERRTHILMFIVVLAVFPAVMQGQGKQKNSGDRKSGATAKNQSPAPDIVSVRGMVLAGNFDMALVDYAQLLEKDSANVSLNAEYAYVLALAGIYDASLDRLDRIWSRRASSPDAGFYISQVFSLMGYDHLSAEFWKKGGPVPAPMWIALKAEELVVQHRTKIPGAAVSGEEDVTTTFKRANRLAAQNHTLGSLALFEEIIARYPDEYLPYVGYSVALERGGFYSRSADALDNALMRIEKTTANDTIRQMLEQRRIAVAEKATATVQTGRTPEIVASLAEKASSGSRKYTAFAGGMISKSYTSLSGKVGTYKKGVGSLSLDLGVLSASGNKSITLGVSAFSRSSVFVSGFGLYAGFGGGAVGLNGKISVGLSFMNKKETGSWDIFFDGLQPIIPKGGVTTVGMSVGRSVYFGNR